MAILIINKIEKLFVRLLAFIFKWQFHSKSGRFLLYPSVRVDNPKNIILETGVVLFRRGWIYAIIDKSESPLIHIKYGTNIYDNFHITSSNKVEIGKKCLINRNVLITDTIHNYENINIPIIEQGIRNSPTIIGDDCWIGNGSVIISSIIGNHCIISANSVLVNKNIPDNCLVGGNPAKIIKIFNHHTGIWERNNY
jgi:acetyltransferase-like isoleucine patch superfamily enzyme